MRPPAEYNVIVADFCSFEACSTATNLKVVQQMTQRIFDGMADIIYNHGGEVSNFMGDAAIGLWETKRRPENKIVAACEALCRGALEITKQWQRKTNFSITERGIRIGWDIGLLVTVRTNCKANAAADIGPSINTAQRLQSAANPNCLIASNLVFERLGVLQGRFTELPDGHVLTKRNGSIKAWSLNLLAQQPQSKK